MLASDQVLDRLGPDVQNLSRGDTLWIHELLVEGLRVMPSQLVRHYRKLRDSDPSRCFDLSLAALQLLAKLMNDTRADDLQREVYADFTMRGLTMYQEVIGEFCGGYIRSDVLLTMQKNVVAARQAFLDRVNAAIVSLLRRHVPTFSEEHVCQFLPAGQSMFASSVRSHVPVAAEAQEPVASARGPRIVSASMANVAAAEEEGARNPDLRRSAVQNQQEESRRSRERSLRAGRSFGGGQLSASLTRAR